MSSPAVGPHTLFAYALATENSKSAANRSARDPCGIARRHQAPDVGFAQNLLTRHQGLTNISLEFRPKLQKGGYHGTHKPRLGH